MTNKYNNIFLRRGIGSMSLESESYKLERHEILIKMENAGICGTDLDILIGARQDKADILGHEGIGFIVDKGADVKRFNLYDKVVFNPVNPDDQNDILGHSRPGIFQNFFKYSLKDKNKNLLHKIDSKISSSYGSLIEPLGTAIYGQSLISKTVNPSTVVIVGAGPIGLINAILARTKGIRVLLVDKLKKRLQLAANKNVVEIEDIFLDSKDLPFQIQRAVVGKPINAILLCTNKEGALSALKRSLEYVSDGGCIDLVGGIKDGDCLEEIDYKDLNIVRRSNVCMNSTISYIPKVKVIKNKHIYLAGHRGTSTKHLDAAINLLSRDFSRYRKIITNSVSLNETPQLIRDVLYNDSDEYIKGEVNF